MATFTNEDLVFESCRARSAVYSAVALRETIAALSRWLTDCMSNNRGARIPGFASFTWTTPPDSASTHHNASSSFISTPLFLASDRFVKQFKLKYRRPVEVVGGVRCEDINYVKLAMRYSKMLSKEDAAMSMKRLIAKLGQCMSRQPSVSFELSGVGKLVSKGGAVFFVFDEKYGSGDVADVLVLSPRITNTSRPGTSHNHHMSASMTASPQQLPSIADESGSLLSSRLARNMPPPTPSLQQQQQPRLHTALSQSAQVRMVVQNSSDGQTSLVNTATPTTLQQVQQTLTTFRAGNSSNNTGGANRPPTAPLRPLHSARGNNNSNSNSNSKQHPSFPPPLVVPPQQQLQPLGAQQQQQLRSRPQTSQSTPIQRVAKPAALVVVNNSSKSNNNNNVNTNNNSSNNDNSKNKMNNNNNGGGVAGAEGMGARVVQEVRKEQQLEELHRIARDKVDKMETYNNDPWRKFKIPRGEVLMQGSHMSSHLTNRIQKWIDDAPSIYSVPHTSRTSRAHLLSRDSRRSQSFEEVDRLRPPSTLSAALLAARLQRDWSGV